MAVVIPCRDEAATIGRCIESLRRQNPAPGLVVVVDDGSSDSSVAIAERSADIVLRGRSGATIGAVRNAGAASAARANVLAFVDADCEARPGWLAAGLASLRGADLVGYRVEASATASWVGRRWSALERRLARDRGMVWAANLMVTKDAFTDVGGFDEALQTQEDVDLCHRLRQRGYIVAVNPLMRVVHHGFPRTLGDFFRRERWHAATPAWWWLLSMRGRALVTAVAALLAAGGVVGALAIRRRSAAVLAGYLATVAAGIATLGALLGGRRDAPRDGILLLLWALARVANLRRGLQRQ